VLVHIRVNPSHFMYTSFLLGVSGEYGSCFGLKSPTPRILLGADSTCFEFLVCRFTTFLLGSFYGSWPMRLVHVLSLETHPQHATSASAEAG
jgi:hypothetical protein